MSVLHYLPESSRSRTYCGRTGDWITGAVISTPLMSRVTCPECLEPEDEISYWIGHRAAKDQMRNLLAKVDESRHAAVIRSYLVEGIDDA